MVELPKLKRTWIEKYLTSTFKIQFQYSTFALFSCLALIPLTMAGVVFFVPSLGVKTLGPRNILLLFAGTVVVCLVTSRLLAARVEAPIKALNRWVQQLAMTDCDGELKFTADGELGKLAGSFNALWQQLEENRLSNELQSWHKDGEAALNTILRGDPLLDEFADRIISFSAEYVGAQVGAFFVNNDEQFTLVASYAYKLRSANDNVFKLGESMVGQAALEKKTILFANVPKEHLTLRVDSGLGVTQPAAIVVVPLLYDDKALGVLELAISTGFGAREIGFLENTAHAVAVALHTAKARTRMANLLSETQRQSEELQTQQEELKAANEELHEQTEKLSSSKHTLQEQREELQATNEELEEKTEKLLRQQAELLKQKNERARKGQEKRTEERTIHAETLPVGSGQPVSNSQYQVSEPKGRLRPPALQPVEDRYTIVPDKKTALIIEDDPAFARILKKIAIKKGYQVLLAESGRDGLLFAEKYLPEAIILDLGLPDMDGMDILNALKEDKTTCHIPVHIASARDRDSTVLQKGSIGYLAKPATSEEIDAVFAKFEANISDAPAQLLIVEDDPVCRRDTVRLFKDLPVEIISTDTGKEALELLENRPFDAVILDLGLPDMNGLTLLDTLDDLPGFELPPVVVYTGRDMNRDEMREFKGKVNSVVVKGVDSRERLLDEVSLFFHAVNSKLPPEQQQKGALHKAPGTRLTDKKVLVVDDDTRNTFAIGRILKQAGMQTVMAADGVQALERLAEEPDIDLVLMDIMMPNMDGYEATRRIRAMDEHKKLPIIAITAKAMSDDRDKCLAAGASDYLAKPVNKEKLLSMLRVWQR